MMFVLVGMFFLHLFLTIMCVGIFEWMAGSIYSEQVYAGAVVCMFPFNMALFIFIAVYYFGLQ